MKAWTFGVALSIVAAPGLADDSVRVTGRLGDAAFYHLVACGKPPGGECRRPLRRWPPELARDITVTMLPAIDRVRPAVAAEIDAALDRAIAAVNAVGAGIRLRRVADNTAALIRVQIRSPRTLALMADETRDRYVPGGMVVFDQGMADRIGGADIVLSSALWLTETKSVVLEELTQSLGLPFDVQGAHYRNRSIFSQDANSVTVLAGQDATALRLHYPPPF